MRTGEGVTRQRLATTGALHAFHIHRLPMDTPSMALVVGDIGVVEEMRTSVKRTRVYDLHGESPCLLGLGDVMLL